MAASVAIAVEEYLRSMYRPDCDYVDGEVIERNVGEFTHALIQGMVMGFFSMSKKFIPFGFCLRCEFDVAPRAIAYPTYA